MNNKEWGIYPGMYPFSVGFCMKIISMYCETLDQAEHCLDLFYNRYDHVRLVRGPWFSESGLYVWEVR